MHLLDPANREPFIVWLSALPVTLSQKWHLKKLWEDHTKLTLTIPECNIIRATHTPTNIHAKN
jgi:hypothetical protein